jgi:hypothetical protein
MPTMLAERAIGSCRAFGDACALSAPFIQNKFCGHRPVGTCFGHQPRYAAHLMIAWRPEHLHGKARAIPRFVDKSRVGFS